MSLPEIIAASKRQKIGSIARDILEARISIIEAARQIALLRHGIGVDRADPDLLLFVGIDSDTDHLPLGDVGVHWAPEALARKDLEIAQAEAFYRDRVFEVCSRLVARFAQEKIPASAYDHYTPNT